ncbi:MAG: glycosyltransferase family 2 protein [Gammaproteobacteria bacterium]
MSAPTGRLHGSTARPKVTFGMPVYNGEAFLEEALRSLLAQTYESFELLVSDNASTDRTSTICRDYASQDARIVYSRNATNIGFSRNQNSVMQKATGKYFLLTHHDDVRLPSYLARTLEVMERDDSIVVCYTKTRDIDRHGHPLPRKDPELRFDSNRLRNRFRDTIRMDHLCEPDFGLIRLDVLRTTRLLGDYADSDRVLLAELVLHGRIHQVPECLFLRRTHALQSTAAAPGRHARTVWFNPALEGKLIFPHFRQFKEYLAAIGRAPINGRDRVWCYGEMLVWLQTNRRRLMGDLDAAGRHFLRPAYYAVMKKNSQ